MDGPHQKVDPSEDQAGEEIGFRVLRDPRIPDPDREARWAAWREDNAEAIAAYNVWFEEHGHPLTKYMIGPGGAV